MKKVGVITIGQSPRSDLIPEISKYIDKDVQIVEYGILDNYTYDEAREKFKPVFGGNILVSRMRDGKQIEMDEETVYQALQEYIYKVENDGIKIILLLCTGKFPQFKCNSLLITPFSIIHSIVKSVAGNAKVGIIVPDISQIPQCKTLWRKSGIDAVIRSASPYKHIDGEIQKAAIELKNERVSMIVMDCMGYTIEMKNMVRKVTEGPVILSRMLVTSILNEIL